MEGVFLIRTKSFEPWIKVLSTSCPEKHIIHAHQQVYNGTITVAKIGQLDVSKHSSIQRFVTDNELPDIEALIIPDSEQMYMDTPLYTARQDVWNICGVDDPNPVKQNASEVSFFKLCSVIEMRKNNSKRDQHQIFDLDQNQVSNSITHPKLSTDPNFDPVVVVMNGPYTFDIPRFTSIFYEFEVFVHDRFPEAQLAENMLRYLLDRHKSIQLGIEKVQWFFDIDPSASKIITSQPSDIQKIDVNCMKTKRQIVREFAAVRCQKVKGHRIRSSELFKQFEKFYTDKQYVVTFADMFTMSTFTPLLKTNSVFQTTRRKEGIYWDNLLVLDIPISQPAYMNYTFVDFDMKVNGKKRLSISEFFAL